MGDADAARLAIRRSERSYDGAQRSAAERANGSFWSGAEWIECADGKARRTPRAESYFRHVAHELSAGIVDCDPARLLVPSFKGRSAAWKLAGNAIVAALAAEVLAALLDTLGESE
jgi:hypothetical protein